MAAAKAALFLQLHLIMTTLGLCICTNFRPFLVSTKSRCSFQFQSRTPAPASASSGSRWRSSAAYGRTTFRHIRGDVDSWRMACSPDEFLSFAPSSAAVAASIDLGPYRNRNNLDDQVFSAMSADGGLKVTVATIRNLLNEMMIQHSMNPVPGGQWAQWMIVMHNMEKILCVKCRAFKLIPKFMILIDVIYDFPPLLRADALGRATICALLASNGMQEEQMFQLSMRGDGPLRGLLAIVTGKGEARGYVGNPSLGDDFTLKEAVGLGTVQVVKNHPDWPRPYNGITSIRHGDIDRDVGIYLAESEQRSCALAAGTSFNGILCTAAGGYLVERLPDCTPETMSHMERNLVKLVQMNGDGEALPTNLLLEGKTPVDIASILLDGLGMEPLDQLEPKPKCPCSAEKLFRSLRLLPREEVNNILQEEGQIEARCQFCGMVYRMGPEEVEKRFQDAKGDPSKDEEWGGRV